MKYIKGYFGLTYVSQHKSLQPLLLIQKKLKPLPVPGEQYKLKVIIDEREYTASCRITEKTIFNIEVSTGLKTDEFGTITDNLGVSFEDKKNEDNFYIVGAKYNIIGIISEKPFVIDFDIEKVCYRC
ncbi:hypothetical protein ABW636_08185 [Aquimarina sp. 2201CG1-2-11]|uniref:hypothetical protein n=1 Tax=Aquimarina discodermiae TaxID=3231043 RepID=UPI003461F249